MGTWMAIALTGSMLAGCLSAPARGEDPAATPPAGDEGGASPDAGGGPPLQACAVSVTYASELRVGGAGQSLLVGGFGVIGNQGDVPVDLRNLDVLGVTAPEQGSLSVNIDTSPEPPLPPGEAHGELDEDVIDAVEQEVIEEWTDDSVPTLFLAFNGDEGFVDSTSVVTLALGNMTFPLSIRFVRGDGFEDKATDSDRVVVPCP